MLTDPYPYPVQHFPRYEDLGNQHLSQLKHQPSGMEHEPFLGLDDPGR